MTSMLWGAINTPVEVITYTELSALAAGASVAGAATFNNIQGNTQNGQIYAEVTAVITMANAPNANTGFSVWFLASADGGTNYERGSSSYTPQRPPDVTFGAPTDTTQTYSTKRVLAPPGIMKFLIQK